MSNRRKPRRLKIIQRTLRKDRDHPEPEFPPLTSAEPPDWLGSVDALALWNQLIGLLLPTGVMTQADVAPLGHLCNAHGEILKLYRAGMEPTAAQRAQLRYLFDEFGLTPASRGKVRPATDGKAKNAFQALTGTE
jgi:phage terminase small subunit